MTTSPQFAQRGKAAPVADVKTRRARTPGTREEIYGAEDLPVLIRLPDLAAKAPPTAAPCLPVAHDMTPPALEASDVLVPSEPEPLRPLPEGPVAQDEVAETAMQRRTRRGGPRPAPVRSTNGLGQYLLALLLAGAIFTVIVTIKERREAASGPQKPAAVGDRVVAPAIELRVSEPTPSIHFNPPELAPPANAGTDPPDASSETALGASEPVAPDAAGYADGAMSVAEACEAYPSTNVAPVQPQSPAAASTADRTWAVPGDGRALRSADRTPADVRYEQR